MHTYFISDLHLTPERPNVTREFMEFMQKDAITADALYILGDLFEYWIGDDGIDFVGASPIIEQMLATSKLLPCYFICGNRDFLITSQFEEETGFQILSDESIIDLYGTKTLLLHGDSLCTDDVAHQHFRQEMMTNETWKKQFLTLSIKERLVQAELARKESAKHKTEISMEIMDVAEQAVIDLFKRSNVRSMIHGHTHRQNTHSYVIDNNNAVRTVLGDWDKTSSILKASSSSLEMLNKKIK